MSPSIVLPNAKEIANLISGTEPAVRVGESQGRMAHSNPAMRSNPCKHWLQPSPRLQVQEGLTKSKAASNPRPPAPIGAWETSLAGHAPAEYCEGAGPRLPQLPLNTPQATGSAPCGGGGAPGGGGGGSPESEAHQLSKSCSGSWKQKIRNRNAQAPGPSTILISPQTLMLKVLWQ